MMKNQKGVTLIALVVTIIVLLILAGVSIAMLTGDNGVLTQANEAKITNIEGRVEEEIDLAIQAAKLAAESETAKNSGYSADGNLAKVKEVLAEDLKNGYTITATASPITIEYAGEDYKKATKNDNAKITVSVTITGNEFKIADPIFTRK